MKLATPLIFLCCAATIPSTLRSEEAGSAPVAADELRQRFEASYLAVHKPIANLDRSYSEALERLLDSETSKGNLEVVLEIRKEIEGFGDGSEFSAPRFMERTASHAPLEALRSKYLSERRRLWALGQKDRETLLANYRTALSAAQQEQTRLGNLDAALALREARSALENDPRFEAPPPETAILANLHLVAKGEVVLWRNGEPLSYENAATEPNKYVVGTSGDVLVAPGDVVHLRVRSTAVYRSFVVAIESKGGTVAFPVALDDIRYLGTASDDAPPKTNADAVLKVRERPEAGRPDDDMAAMWEEMPLSALSQNTSEWAKSGPGPDWHEYAFVIREKMFQKISAE